MVSRPTKTRGIVPKAIGDVVGYWRSAGKGAGPVLLAGGRPERRREVAEGVASELGVPFYAVDLSFVVSQYIGETEKSLADVFDLAEAGGALLLFDEAEALFGKDAAVKGDRGRAARALAAELKKRLARYKGRVLLGSAAPGSVGGSLSGKPLHAVAVAGRRPATGPGRRASSR